MEHIEEKDVLTPLAQMFRENADLCNAMDALQEKVQEVYPDAGDDLDAMCMIRDAAIFRIDWIRNERVKEIFDPNTLAGKKGE